MLEESRNEKIRWSFRHDGLLLLSPSPLPSKKTSVETFPLIKDPSKRSVPVDSEICSAFNFLPTQKPERPDSCSSAIMSRIKRAVGAKVEPACSLTVCLCDVWEADTNRSDLVRQSGSNKSRN